jgi:hypothetical protein
MVTLCRAYTSTHAAENAVERLLAAGGAALRVELIVGHAVEDARDAPIGTFAGTTTPDAETVGSFGDLAHSGREAMGTFAGDPDRQRHGAFGDTDRDTVTDYRPGITRTRIASHSGLERILIDAGLDRATAVANVRALHAGRVLVLVQGESADAIAAVIDEPALRAAA